MSPENSSVELLGPAASAAEFPAELNPLLLLAAVDIFGLVDHDVPSYPSVVVVVPGEASPA
mgnify:CR=1 FL=1